MKRFDAVMLSVTGFVFLGCAGSLDDPSRFEQGQSSVRADDYADGGTLGNGGGGSGDGTADGNGGTDGTGNGGGGGDGASEPDGGAVAGGCDAAPILANKCATAGCHSAADKLADLDLTPEGFAERLAGKSSSESCGGAPIFDAADPGQSLVYLKVTDAPPCGSRMPFAAPLSPDEQACLLQWLESL